MSARIGRLDCGHERWLPFDYAPGTMLTCSECGDYDLHPVINTTPDFDAMPHEQVKEYMRKARSQARGSAPLPEDTSE